VTRRTRLSPSFATLKWLSFAHSAIYAALLTAWLVPGLHPEEFIFGLGHGLGWILMCILCSEALRTRTISLRLAVCVAIIGAVGPFVGSAAFVYEDRRRIVTAANTNPR
jgi:hypothetical protein